MGTPLSDELDRRLDLVDGCTAGLRLELEALRAEKAARDDDVVVRMDIFVGPLRHGVPLLPRSERERIEKIEVVLRDLLRQLPILPGITTLYEARGSIGSLTLEVTDTLLANVHHAMDVLGLESFDALDNRRHEQYRAALSTCVALGKTPPAWDGVMQMPGNSSFVQAVGKTRLEACRSKGYPFWTWIQLVEAEFQSMPRHKDSVLYGDILGWRSDWDHDRTVAFAVMNLTGE